MGRAIVPEASLLAIQALSFFKIITLSMDLQQSNNNVMDIIISQHYLHRKKFYVNNFATKFKFVYLFLLNNKFDF